MKIFKELKEYFKKFKIILNNNENSKCITKLDFKIFTKYLKKLGKKNLYNF